MSQTLNTSQHNITKIFSKRSNFNALKSDYRQTNCNVFRKKKQKMWLFIKRTAICERKNFNVLSTNINVFSCEIKLDFLFKSK